MAFRATLAGRPRAALAPGPMSQRALLLASLAAVTAARLLVLALAGVPPENAYFYACAERPALGYFDGPAGTAMVVRAAAALGGELWNFLGPLWAALATLAAWRLAKKLGGISAAWWSAALLNSLPAFNAHALQAGPVLPALAFTLTGLSFSLEALRSQEGGWGHWIAAAAAFLGASLFSPFMLPAALAVGIWGLASARRSLDAVGGVAAALAATGGLLPWMAWMASQDWVPLGGWTWRGLLEPSFTDAAAGILAYASGLSPLPALLLPVAVAASWKTGGEKARLTAAAATLSSAVLAFWIYRGWPAGDLALLPASVAWGPWLATRLRAALWGWLAVVSAGGLSIFGLWQAARPGPEAQAAEAILALDERLEPSLRSHLFFIAGDARLAAALDYALRARVIPPEGHPRVYTPENPAPASQFDLWPSYAQFTPRPPTSLNEEGAEEGLNPFHGHAAIYAAREPPSQLPQAIRGAFGAVELVQQVGHEGQTLYLYLCLDYQSLPL